MLGGVAGGDALGMPTEFLTSAQIQDWYGHVDGLLAPHPDHPHHRLPAGSVTDDTDHTLLLAELLLRNGRIETATWAEQLLRWSQTPRVQENRFVGPSTLKTLAAWRAGTPPAQTPRNGVTVGAAMRMAAVAIAFADRDELVEQVVATCSVTHYTRNAISGAMAMAFALAETLREAADPASVARAAQAGAAVGRNYGDWSWAPAIEQRIEYVIAESRSQDEAGFLAWLRDMVGVDLYPEQLVPNAIGLLLAAQGDPMRAMRWAAVMGGDTDTLASMAGSLCGGLRGWATIDPALVAQVERVNGLDLRRIARELVALRMRHV
jgi:ADP-ribosylglycohydrolase